MGLCYRSPRVLCAVHTATPEPLGMSRGVRPPGVTILYPHGQLLVFSFVYFARLNVRWAVERPVRSWLHSNARQHCAMGYGNRCTRELGQIFGVPRALDCKSSQWVCRRNKK